MSNARIQERKNHHFPDLRHARAPRQQRHRPPGLPLRTMLCHICRRADVDAVDVALANGRRVRGLQHQSRRRHVQDHLWAWILDLDSPAEIRTAVTAASAPLLRELNRVRQLGTYAPIASFRRNAVRFEALAALARIDEWARGQDRRPWGCTACTYAGTSIQRPPLARALALADGRRCECGRWQ